jgi:bacterioferritin
VEIAGLGEIMSRSQASGELISLLNRAVSRELQVSIQYMLQHAILAGAESAASAGGDTQSRRGKFVASHSPAWLPGSTLKKVAITEMRHAEAIAERVVALGERPTTEATPIVIGDTPREMIAEDESAESGAIQLYTEIVAAAQSEGDETTKKLFQRILSDEREHHRIFTNLLQEI